MARRVDSHARLITDWRSALWQVAISTQRQKRWLARQDDKPFYLRPVRVHGFGHESSGPSSAPMAFIFALRWASTWAKGPLGRAALLSAFSVPQRWKGSVGILRDLSIAGSP